MIGAFAGPLLLAFSSYHWSWPFSASPDSRGELLSPVEPLPAFTGTTRNGERFTLDDMHGRWWLLVAGGADDCDLHCAADLFKVRQVRRAVGRERVRVRTAYVSTARVAGERLAEVMRRHPETRLLLSADGLAERLARHGIYLVDPHGNLVLYYAQGSASKDVRRDLYRLLKASRIG